MKCGTCSERTHWSHMECGEPECPGTPHVWNSHLCLYGPYLCSAYVGRRRKT